MRRNPHPHPVGWASGLLQDPESLVLPDLDADAPEDGQGAQMDLFDVIIREYPYQASR
jgi:hypothetical protein